MESEVTNTWEPELERSLFPCMPCVGLLQHITALRPMRIPRQTWRAGRPQSCQFGSNLDRTRSLFLDLFQERKPVV